MNTDKDYQIEIYEILEEMCNSSKGNTIKGITVKRSLLHKGSKYKWQDGVEFHFKFENEISFICNHIEYYEDTNDYKQKDLIVSSEYSIFKIKGIEKDKILQFLKYKLRVIRIEKLLNEGK